MSERRAPQDASCSMWCRGVWLAALLALWCSVGDGVPLGLGIVSNFLDAGNATALLADLALAHIEHKLDTLAALADLAALVANVTGTALIG